jgi:hypothetical protein
MEVYAEGYFKKIDNFNRIVLVNLEYDSMEKLKKVEINLRMNNPKSPILPNGIVLKHDLCAKTYDIDGIPTSTPMLIGQKVSVRAIVKKYRFPNKGNVVIGWSLKLLEMKAI